MSWFRKREPKFHIGYKVAFIEYVDGAPNTLSFREYGSEKHPDELEFTVRLKKGVVIACDHDGVSIRTNDGVVTRGVANVRWLHQADELL